MAKGKKETFTNNFNKIVTHTLHQNPEMRIDFSLQENKKTGIKYLNMRQFKSTEDYDGPTKNGFSFVIEDGAEIELLQKAFDTFFELAKQHV